MVSIRRHSRWKGPLGPERDPPLRLQPVEVATGGGDEPVCFLRDIDLHQPPPVSRGRGRGRPRGSGCGRGRGGRGRGGGGQLLGHSQRGRGRGRRRCQVPRGLLLRSNLPADAKSVVLGLAAQEPNDGDKIAALVACKDSNMKGSQESCIYLREGGFHETVPFAIPVEVMTDFICEEVLLELGGGNTPNEIEEQHERDQTKRIAEQTDVSQERDGKVAKVKGRGSNKSSNHMASRGKRKRTNDLIEKNNPKKALAMKLDNTWKREATARREMLENICSGIKYRVEEFKKGVGDVFVVPPFDLPPDKYDGVPGVILRATDITDLVEQDFFTYVQQDMNTIQVLLNAETVNNIALSSQISKILSHWTKLFSSHISGGMAQMMQALNELKSLVASDVVSPLPFDAAGVTAHKTRIEEALKEAAAFQQTIPGAYKEIDQVSAAAHMKCDELAALKEKQMKKISKLRASLARAEETLKETESQETEIKQLLKESKAARQDSSKYSDDLKKTIDSWEYAKTEVQKCMEYIGVGSKSTQPKPVRSLISYMQSSSCEG